ncbi:large conductance mechanosensitive channel protein MscL [Sphingomicrobium flavum]|uniref:large conductance mechanosensitive channel protein MscL n=1 Tax=Sphingomicrobium flavum TaxID=1229164 RepID=UPI0021ADBA6C|nr:large conductance mechanosensitive channel protein MscL [Sphingomicrobium flavum]
MLKEFKEFIAKGNVIDLAVAVIIGGAFALITSSLTDDVIMPIVGAIFGGADFSNYFTLLGDLPEGFAGNPNSYTDLKEAGAAVVGWGQFITVVINFLILAFIIFIMVKQVNRVIAKKEDEPAETGPSETDLLKDILAELKKNN